jgi:DNA-binding transcriptional LysR family regulator
MQPRVDASAGEDLRDAVFRGTHGTTLAAAHRPLIAYGWRVDLSRHLRHFLAVAEELHFGRAADLLSMAQPPLSQSIQRLERELGVTLFDRSRRQIRLTTAGQLLRDEAQALLAREQRMRTVMRMVRDGRLGTLRAGVPPETPATTLQALVRRLTSRAPELDIDLQELSTGEQMRMFADAQLDVGLVHHPIDTSGMRLGPAVEVRLGAVLPRTSPLARLSEVTLSDLAGHDLIVAPRATAPGWHDHLIDVCREHGFSPTRIRHARNPEFLLGLVLAGRGVAFDQEALARREARIAWRPITGHPLRKTTSAAWPATSPHPAVSTFAEIAADTLSEAEHVPTLLVAPATPRPWSIVYGASDAASRS